MLFPCQKTAKHNATKTINPMYNQRALLADIVITPALQTANQDASPGPTQPQVADSLDGKNGMIPCPNQAGDQSGCHFHGNHASKMPSGSTTALLVPITLREANAFVESHHRHNGRTARNGGKFAVGVEARTRTGEGITLVGVAIVGNPLSATYMDGFTAEVLRVCTSPEAPKNICSMLYSACWRAWRAMGGRENDHLHPSI